MPRVEGTSTCIVNQARCIVSEGGKLISEILPSQKKNPSINLQNPNPWGGCYVVPYTSILMLNLFISLQFFLCNPKKLKGGNSFKIYFPLI